MKTLLELAELEITELEYALNNESDMADYVSQFAEYTAATMHHILKSLVKENKELKAKQAITIKRRVAV